MYRVLPRVLTRVLTPVLTLCLCLPMWACAPAQAPAPVPPAPVPPAGADTCDGRRHAGLVGQPDTALERVLILGQVRVLRPGTAPGPARPERLTFVIGPEARIARISCS